MPRAVRYCPGSAPGRPSWMLEDAAQRAYSLDVKYLEVLWVWGKVIPVWPHTGRCAVTCKHYQSEVAHA